jgi:hypothetical protein
MTTPEPAAIREWHDITPAHFHEQIVPLAQPAVLRGAVRDWPAVRAGASSPRAIVDYLLRFDCGAQTLVTAADASIGGRIFYDQSLTGFNFHARRQGVADMLREILAGIDDPLSPSLYVSALMADDHLPGFSAENVLPLLPASVGPRAWLGTRVTVQTHYDAMENIACVVAGRRRFTLFPADQVRNLYAGPLDFTPAGTPVSMVRLDAPDFERYPRFREALQHAQSAELGPGDAIYIPYMWWHHVEALAPLNVLINYWWVDTPAWVGAPFDALIHALHAVRTLPAAKRAVWREWFEHFIFQSEFDTTAHLPEGRRGVQGPPSAQTAAMIRTFLLKRLAREQQTHDPMPPDR